MTVQAHDVRILDAAIPLPNVAVVTPPQAPAETLAAPDLFDRLTRAIMARWTGGLSPATLALALLDWQLHLAASPGKQLALASEAACDLMRFFETLATPIWSFRAGR
jgi:polyhydroxyalkanoate synthase